MTRLAALALLASLGAQLPGARPAPTQPLVTDGGQTPAGLPTEVGEPGTVVARFEGTPSEAMAAIRRLSADEAERAVALAREMAENEALDEPLRAEFRFAEGVVLAEMGAPSSAVAPFLSARALAGPGELRDAATYDHGTAQLLVAEALREEAFRALMDPGAPVGGPGGAPPVSDADDPFAKPRAAYLSAKATLLERLRAGGENLTDTRANLELIQRRLKELDQLEQQREEQEQQDQEQQQDGEDEHQEPGEEGDEGDKGEQEDGEQQQDEQEPGGEEPQQPEDQPASDPDVNAPEQQQTAPDSGELPEVQETQADPEDQSAERLLSREEVLRLLDKLEALEGEREELEAQLRAVQRIPVEEDW